MFIKHDCICYKAIETNASKSTIALVLYYIILSTIVIIYIIYITTVIVVNNVY